SRSGWRVRQRLPVRVWALPDWPACQPAEHQEALGRTGAGRPDRGVRVMIRDWATWIRQRDPQEYARLARSGELGTTMATLQAQHERAVAEGIARERARCAAIIAYGAAIRNDALARELVGLGSKPDAAFARCWQAATSEQQEALLMVRGRHDRA